MNDVSGALQRIARGAGLVFAGTVISTLLGFGTRAIVARALGSSQYGIFSLVLTIINIGVIIATLGFHNGLPREVSRYLKKHPEKVSRLISTAIVFIILTSTSMTFLIIIGAPEIADVFKKDALTYPLVLGAIVLPFLASSNIVIAISRGMGRVRENVYYKNTLFPSLFLLFAVVAIGIKTDVTTVFIAYLISQAIGFLILFLDSLRLRIIPRKMVFDFQIAKELVVFSFPLMLTGILGYIMNWTDTLMLGYYYPSDVVGLYNAAAPIARWLPVFLNAVGFLYTPIATALFVQGNLDDVKKLYQITTRWIFLLTFPLFVLIFAFPVLTIEILFGSNYLGSSTALQILALGFMSHVFLGLNGMSLTVTGNTNANFIGNLIAAAFNVALNFLLIPVYGIEGAAIATAVSYITANLFRSWWLYKETRIHPFSWSYLKQLGSGISMLGVLYAFNIHPTSIWELLGILSLFEGLYLGAILMLKTVEAEDIELIEAIGKRFGINLEGIIKILKKFS